MISMRMSTPADGERVVEIWREAVDATHGFLSPEDRAAIEAEVRTFLPQAALWLAVDAAGRPVGFMGLTDSHMDALFIDPAHRGGGVGRALVDHAIALHGVLTTDVNAQNAQAVGFYERLGFRPTGRSALDDQGRPYPLIHMRRAPDAG
ncbi:MAG: acetyltransferase [Phenylobacterium zucineum]|nr:MAG: acetyltransferase [Phenylobacterium zucineum]